MEITALSVAAIAMVFAAICFSESALLILLIVTSVFQAGSVLNLTIGDAEFGLQPGLFGSILFIGRIVFTRAISKVFFTNGTILRMYAPLYVFVLLAGCSALLMPFLFSGQVIVYAPRSGLDPSSASELHHVTSNITQTIYIFLMASLAFCVTTVVMRNITSVVPKLSRAFLWSGVVVSLIGAYQVVGHYCNWWFPQDILFSNPSYYLGYAQEFAGVKRMSSTFTEPSVFAYYLGGVLAFSGTLIVRFGGSWLVFAAFFLSFLSMLLTMSTTAYLVLSVVTISLMLYAIKYFLYSTSQAGYVKTRFLVLWLCISLCLEVLVGVIASSPENSLNVIAQVTYEKTESLSAEQRFGADWNAVKNFVATYGLGVGWGSERSSMLYTTLLATSGIWGGILLGVFIWYLLLGLYRGTVLWKGQWPPSLDHWPWLAAMGAFLTSGVAVPDLTFPIFWVTIGVLVAIVAYYRLQIHRQQRLSFEQSFPD